MQTIRLGAGAERCLVVKPLIIQHPSTFNPYGWSRGWVIGRLWLRYHEFMGIGYEGFDCTLGQPRVAMKVCMRSAGLCEDRSGHTSTCALPRIE